MGCKHKLKTLQQQVISSSAYFDGLFQCEKCLKLFVFGADDINSPNYIKEIKIKGEAN